MIAVVALAASVSCGRTIDVADAERLILATPTVRAAVAARKARPFFEYVETHPGGWYFEVKVRNPCLRGPGTCSNLLGHYSVTKTGDVEDLDQGDDGKIVSNPRMAAIKRKMLLSSCGKGR
jgi:hypothetical protein